MNIAGAQALAQPRKSTQSWYIVACFCSSLMKCFSLWSYLYHFGSRLWTLRNVVLVPVHSLMSRFVVDESERSHSPLAGALELKLAYELHLSICSLLDAKCPAFILAT